MIQKNEELNLQVFVGPGARKEASLVGLGLAKLSSRRKDDMAAAKRYAMDISIKQIMLRQQKQQQENVCIFHRLFGKRLSYGSSLKRTVESH